jgi:hypothetical protein
VAQAGNGDDGNNVNASSFAKATDVATSSIWNKNIIYIFSSNEEKKKIYISYKTKFHYMWSMFVWLNMQTIHNMYSLHQSFVHSIALIITTPSDRSSIF